MRDAVKNAEIDFDEKMDIAVALNNIKVECESNNPSKTNLSDAIKSIGIKIAGTVLATSLKPYIEKTVEWFRTSSFFTAEQCVEMLNAYSK